MNIESVSFNRTIQIVVNIIMPITLEYHSKK